MKDKKTKVKSPNKKSMKQIKLILATLRAAMEGCDTYDQFKFYINHCFKEESCQK